MTDSIVFVFVSLAISVALVLVARKIITDKFSKLQGSQKLIGIVSIIIGISEAGYLAINFALLDFALEIITSVGVGLVILGIALQHQLKNIVAGLGLFFNKEINVGDIIKIKEEKGTITELHLTKTIALTDDGEKLIIPNQKFSEDLVKIKHKQRKNLPFDF